MAGPSSSASFRSFLKSQAKTFALGDKEKALGPSQTREISNEMKSVVWIIMVDHPNQDGNGTVLSLLTGFCVHPEGYIFTVAHGFPENFTKLMIRKIDDTEFRLSENGHVRLVEKYDPYDIALLKVEIRDEGDMNGFNYAIFGESELFVGQEVISIAHPYQYFYTTARGEIAYPCVNNIELNKNSNTIKDSTYKGELNKNYGTPNYRKARDIIRKSDEKLAYFGVDVPLIQINNLHNSTGSSGCPIFNSNGHVVGMFVFNKVYDFAVHISCLKEIFNTYMKKEQKKFKGKSRDEKKEKKKILEDWPVNKKLKDKWRDEREKKKKRRLLKTRQ